jgi:hypothetical protein
LAAATSTARRTMQADAITAVTANALIQCAVVMSWQQ